jgi:hypothetical protein
VLNESISPTVWLTIPDLVGRMDLSPSRIRRLIDDHTLAAKRVDGILCIPESFLDGTEARPELRGTITVLIDQGYKGDDVVDWLISYEESLKATPIDALIAGRKAEVRRIAQALA